MNYLVEMSSKWAALILVLTTCVVLVYFVLLLTSIFKGDRHVKSVLMIGEEEVAIETKAGKKIALKHHKLFWMAIGIAYLIVGLLAFWYILLALLIFVLCLKLITLLAKAKLKA